MFNDLNENIKMLKGAYRKLKSYYYYNKNLLMMKKKIAEFEKDEISMNMAFEKMANVLQNPRTKSSRDYYDNLLSSINFIVLPKKFDSEQITNNRPVTNTIARNKKLKNINFFIDAPIEVYILDTLWSLFLSKIAFDNKILSYDVYGNTVNVSALFHDDEILFENRILFNRYFYKYSSWRNNAFSCLESLYDRKKDSILISMDLKSYFYSATVDFDNLEKYFGEHKLFKTIRSFTLLFEKIYEHYFLLISPFYKGITTKKHSYILPIGLFSSMVIGNVYMADFDKEIRKHNDIRYYGRYVDDMIFVFEKNISKESTNKDIINELLVNSNFFILEDNEYRIKNKKNLRIQSNKVKIIYINHCESKAIIDIYNDTIKVIPSQMDPLPDELLNLNNFDESAYTIDNFSKENKLRDIGPVDIDTFRVGKLFYDLISRYSHINVKGKEESQSIDEHIRQINIFLSGSQRIEFYTSWLNYAYFLVITEKNRYLRKFISETKKQINQLKGTSLDRNMYKKTVSLNKKVKEALLEHLEICVGLALVLDSEMVENHFKSKRKKVAIFEQSNMFNHNFVAFPLANYLKYSENVSYIKMEVKQLGKIPKSIVDEFKFIWSPRFIHYDELILLRFYAYHIASKKTGSYDYNTETMVKEFCAVNHLDNIPFEIKNNNINEAIEKYKIYTINIPCKKIDVPDEMNVAVGSVNLSPDKCMKGWNRWDNITLDERYILEGILRDTYKNIKNKESMLLVLPELCFPIYWIGELIKFAKRTQIAIVTGLQYMIDNNGMIRNYVLTLLPFVSGNKNYKNVYAFIREKNDYSPIEFTELAKHGYKCENMEEANYQIFKWNNILLSSILCYEFTDVMVRALLKGQCDIIAAPVYNKDTTYFSNIIDTTVRDLHAFVVQANTSFYGDSRITGPYDRDSKDIFKIKGGDNDHVVVGKIKIKEVKKFERNYYKKQKEIVSKLLIDKDYLEKEKNKKTKKKPEIKPLSARFKRKLDNK